MKFKSVSAQINLPEVEDKINQFWKENKIFEKSVEQRDVNNLFVFVDGPPFVTGMPHYGSLLPSIAKDLIPRYQTMLGKRVRRVWGWDCHGLPVEDKVNQILGIKSSKQLEEEFGIAKYVQECRRYVEGVTSDWRWYVEKIGRWADMDNAYYTMHPEFMESVIWAFKQIYEKGLVYKGKRVSLYSTDTSTPVSEFEVAMDPDNYRDVEDLSIFVKFKLENVPEGVKDKVGDRAVFLVAWTTTPWTIPSNFALAVNQEFNYVLLETADSLLIIAKDRLTFTLEEKAEDIKILAEFKGSELEGLKYEPIYKTFLEQSSENDFKIYLSGEVTAEEGTGVLHIAPAFGEVDFDLGQKLGLSMLADVDQEGKMIVEPWKGVYLRDASPLIAKDMQEKGNLLRSHSYTHRLPFYRGSNPLIYMAQDAYFINIQKVKNRMLELNKKINWIPRHIKNGRFAQTIESSPDWCISRNRYWATIMPIWRSKDGEEIIVGSIEELASQTDQIEKRTEEGKAKYYFQNNPMDLHRDVCDQIILKKDGKEFSRVPEVLDVWMDSGSVPFAEYHYPFENRDVFEKSRPADFIVEYTPQVRAWFNILHRLSTILFDGIAFKTAISHGTIAGTDGRKMSKSFGNYPDPKLILEKYGGDALRLYFMSSPVMLGEDMNFSEDSVAENYRFLLTLWNSYKYFIDYATTFDWKPAFGKDRKEALTVLDKWILSRLNSLIFSVRKELDEYNIPKAVKALKEFLTEELSTWYIRRSRERISANEDPEDRGAALGVMHNVLVAYCKLIAPVIPFVSDEIYRNLTEELSVHLTDYPLGDKDLVDEDLEADMRTIRELVEIGHAQRKESGIKLRQPLLKFTYQNIEKLSEDLEKILAEELNVKEVEYKKSSEDNLTGEMNTNITPELKTEGEARDLIRQVQQLRKEANLTLKDKVRIVAPVIPDSEELRRLVLKQTNSIEISKGDEIRIEIVNG